MEGARKRASLRAISARAPNFRSYTARGGGHSVLDTPFFFTVFTHGEPLSRWVGQITAGRPVPRTVIP